jgi:Sulfotransferase family
MSSNRNFSLVESTRFFIIEKYKTVFTEIPKVACSSFKLWIAELLDIEFDRNKWEYIHDLKLPMEVGYEMEKKFPDYFKFCSVRNPWDRLLSCWLSKIKTEDWDDGKNWRKGVENNFWRYGDLFWTEMPFTDFINSVVSIQDNDSDAHFRSQHTFIYNRREILFWILSGDWRI